MPEQIFNKTVLRSYRGPASELMTLKDEQGYRYIGIRFYEQYSHHPMLVDSLDGVIDLLKGMRPRGLVPLMDFDADAGAFLYGTGDCVSIAELIRQCFDRNIKPGVRAGIELLLRGAEIIRMAIDISQEEGIYSHGGLTPWRMLLSKDGQVKIIGYAIPQIEMLVFRDDPSLMPREDSFRYAPPERINPGEVEDETSDLFSLVLVAFELITMQPMYDGAVSEIQEMAQRADVAMRLSSALMDGVYSREVFDFFQRALHFERQDRFVDIESFIEDARHLLQQPSVTGLSLADINTEIQRNAPTNRPPVKQMAILEDPTGIISRNDIQRELQDELQSQSIIEQEKMSGEIERIRAAVIPETTEEKPGNVNDLLSMLRASHSKLKLEPERTSNRSRREQAPPSPKPTVDETPKEPLDSSLVTRSNRIPRAEIELEAESKSAPPQSESRSQDVNPLLEMLRASQIQKGKAAPMPDTPAEVTAQKASLSEVQVESMASKPGAALEQNASSLPESLIFGESLDLDGVEDAVADKAPASNEVSATAASMEESDPSRNQLINTPVLTDEMETAIFQRPTTPDSPVQLAAEELGSKANSTQSSKKSVSRETRISEQIVSKGGAQRAPQTYLHRSPKGKTLQFSVSFGEGQRARKLSIPRSATVAECVALFLLNKVISLRTDLLGNIRAHYRFSEKGKPCSGLIKMGELGQQDLMLVPVPNTVIVASFEVDTGSDLLQFRAPVGQAVPVAAILDHLICWLGLSAGKWELSVGGDVLDHSIILFDVGELLESRTLICRQRSK